MNSEATQEPSSRPRRKPRLPPPPPPPVQKAREKRHLIKNSQHLKKTETDVENNSLAEVNSENISLIPYGVTFNVGGSTDTKNHFENKNYSENSNAARSTSAENKYPSLLFTFQDFQSVMGESKEKNETTSKETFVSNNLIDESKVCFRVTTTNVPFEKCLGNWQNSFDNPEFESYEENLFIFDDYIDRSKRTNARPDLFRMESLENSPNDILTNTSKVRFVIESPSNSTPDDNAEITMDSLENLESLNKDLEELQKIQSICDAIQHSKENDKSETFDSLLCDGEDFNLIEINSNSLCENPIKNQGNQEHREFRNFTSLEENPFNGISSLNDISPAKEVSSDDETSTANGICSVNEIATIENFTNEISANEIPINEIPLNEIPTIEFSTNECSTNEITKLQRYETCLSSDQLLIQDAPIRENSKVSKFEFRSQKSKSDSYEDACDSEGFIPKIKNVEIQKLASDKLKDKNFLIDSSLCDFINEDNDNIQWNSSSDEEKEIQPTDDSKSNEIQKSDDLDGNFKTNHNFEQNQKFKEEESFPQNQQSKINPKPTVEKYEESDQIPILSPQKSVPVSVRRNSFLDKMLSDEMSCEVIAIHRKPDDPKQEKIILSTNWETETKQEIPFISSKIEIVKKSEIDEKKKSVGEAKCDVLNELLCNFSAIKLKSVPAVNNKNDCDTSANLVKFVDKSVREQKTDDDDNELIVENDGSASAKVTDSNDALPCIMDRIASVDKCAIDKTSPKTCNNSIDNNAKTPVALSIDQSHDAFSITPGSVRNFIKHYEIHQDTNFKARTKETKENDLQNKENHLNNNDFKNNHFKITENDSRSKVNGPKDKEHNFHNIHNKESDSNKKSPKNTEADPRNTENDPKNRQNDFKEMDSDSKTKNPHPIEVESDSRTIKNNKDCDYNNQNQEIGSKTMKSVSNYPKDIESYPSQKDNILEDKTIDKCESKTVDAKSDSKLEPKSMDNSFRDNEMKKEQVPERRKETENNLKESNVNRCKSLEVMMINSKQESGSCLQSSRPHVTIGRRHSCIKSNDSSPVSELKKSVQFDSACTVYQLQKHEENTKSSLINGIRSRIKGKAPNKPEMQMPITFKTSLRSDDSTPEVQNESEVQSAGNTSKSESSFDV